MNRVTAVLLALVCAYGALLRVNALEDRYGVVQRPGWARVLTADVAPAARYVQPASYAWPRFAVPYIGGDPASYLKFAREMRSFYQAHPREPMYLVITRLWLWLLDGQDVGISFASASMSMLVVVAAFLLGRAAFSPAVGLLAALGFAIDRDAVMWAPEGWRDDTFTAFFVLGAWALVRLRQHPTWQRAIIAGVICAAACLTRITSIGWVLPGFAIVGVTSADRSSRLRAAGIGAAACALLVAPYLFNCWRVLRDPLVAINVHTGYYRNGEGLDPRQPMSARAYIGTKIATSPVRELDTATTGIFVLPLQNKFGSFDDWVPGLAAILRCLAVAGLVIWLFLPIGRMLTIIWLTALVPYAFTWNIADGAAWRFTMHVYPLFLIAAFSGVQVTVALMRRMRHEGWPRSMRVRHVATAVGVGGAAILAVVGYADLPYYVSAEAVRSGGEETIGAGNRDEVFFTNGWAEPMTFANVTSRVVLGDHATMQVPLEPGRPYRLTLRLDPVCPDAPRSVVVLVSGTIVARVGFGFDPSRIGSYDVDVPKLLARGNTTLRFVADKAVPAGRCGPLYAAMPPDIPISLRVWYVRIHPL